MRKVNTREPTGKRVSTYLEELRGDILVYGIILGQFQSNIQPIATPSATHTRDYIQKSLTYSGNKTPSKQYHLPDATSLP